MAGSHASSHRSTDSMLKARLDALQLLADHVSDRVLIVAPDFTILYANESAWPEHKRAAIPTKCYEAFLNRSDPCGACAAKEIFKSPEVRSISCTIGGNGSACGLHQAFPLLCGDAQPEAVMVLFNRHDSRRPVDTVVRPSASEQAPSVRTFLGDLIGCSAVMQDLFEMIELVADSQATVLLQGESGTGKELAAKTIHRLSHRSDRPFIVVDCGSLPETLLASELFGHVKGAFTGAVASKKGLFEEADGGTLFLDEIADTTPQFQAKLLRVVQEGEIKPVGSSRAVKVDVRIISATNKDLLDLTKTKAFRHDLYYRLAVLPLMMPALRDRREDIPLLARHFIDMSCRRHRKALRIVTDAAMHALIDAPWPGNVRELQHVIERAVVTGQMEILHESDLFGLAPAEARKTDLPSVAKRALHTAERVGIQEALRQASGNKARAARLLKISRASLYNKLRIYDIPS